VTDKPFAHTPAATYTLLAAPNNAGCTANVTPWPCCTGSTTGVCGEQDQGIEIDNFTIASNQVEDYGRCTNSSTEDGKACRGYCSADSSLPYFACSENSDCITGTCVNAALCPGANLDCDGASHSPAGTGSINLIDASGSAGITVTGLTALDHLKGKGVLVGQLSSVTSNNLVAVSGSTWTAPYSTFGGTLYADAVTYAVTHGIQAGGSSIVDNNRVRATTLGVDVVAATAGGNGLDVRVRPTRVQGNQVRGLSDNYIGVRVAAVNSLIEKNNVVVASGDSTSGITSTGLSATVSGNIVDIKAGDYVRGILATGNSTSVSGNVVDVRTAGDTDGVGIEVRGSGSRGGQNAINVAHTTRATGMRIGSTSCSGGANVFPNCVDGYQSGSSNDFITVAAGGVGIETFGDFIAVDGTEIGLGTDAQGVAVGQNSQQRFDNLGIWNGGVGFGPTDRKYCVGGADNGKICKQGTVTAAACSGGTCTYDDFGTNASISNSRLGFQTQMGAYLFTGAVVSNNYISWQSGTAVMLGDDRVNTGKTSGHFAITGGIIHTNTAGASLIRYAPVAPALCAGVDTPWDCCTGSGTGTCPSDISNGTITGVDLLGGSVANAISINLGATGWSANSPNISNIAIVGNNCQPDGSGTICIGFPSTNQSKVTNILVSGTRSASATAYSNFTWAQGRIAEFVQRFWATGTGLVTSNPGTTAEFFPVDGRASISTTEANHSMVAIPGSALSMKCDLTAAPGGAFTRTFTLRKAGVDQILACVISGAATSCTDTDQVDFTTGQIANWQAVKSTGTGAVAAGVGCMLEYGVNPY